MHDLGGHVTPGEPMYASETDLHGALLRGVPQRWWPESLPGASSPDEGLEDVPQGFDEVGGVHNIERLQVLLVPEEEKVR